MNHYNETLKKYKTEFLEIEKKLRICDDDLYNRYSELLICDNPKKIISSANNTIKKVQELNKELMGMALHTLSLLNNGENDWMRFNTALSSDPIIKREWEKLLLLIKFKDEELKENLKN